MDFKNKLTHNGIHYSRYIASWTNEVYWRNYSPRLLSFGNTFKKWLRSEGLTDKEVNDIVLMATNGKLELEESAKRFMTTK